MSKKAKKKQIKSTSTSAENQFKQGDLVGGKVKGHPLWPGQIEKLDFVNGRPKYTIRFFGSNDTSRNCIQVKLFKDFTKQEKTRTTKGFKEAYSICQKEYDALNSTKKEEDEVEPKDVEENNLEDDDEVACPDFEIVIKKEKATKREENEENSKLSPKEAKRKTLTDPSAPVPELVSSPTLNVKDEEKTPAGRTKNSQARKKSDGSSVKRIKRDTKTRDLLADPVECGKVEKPVHANQKVSARKKSNIVQHQTKSPKSEGENVMIESKERTIAKLMDKVNKKIKEKEDRKVKMKEIKRAKKASEKLEPSTKILFQVSQELKKYSSLTISNHLLRQEWNKIFQKYNKVLPILDKCFEYDYFMDNQRRKINQSEYRKCHETLEKVVKNLREAQKNEHIPANMKKNFKECLKVLKTHKCIKRFKNEFPNQKNAMIERNDNEAARVEKH